MTSAGDRAEEAMRCAQACERADDLARLAPRGAQSLLVGGANPLSARRDDNMPFP